MKRGYYLLFLLILLLANVNASTSQETGVSVSVVSNIPSLELISPLNTTYQEDDFILLDYSSNLINTVWYNLDNGANTTINTSFYFQTSVGIHTLYLYGNQSNGTLLSDNITFTVEESAAPSTGGGKKEVIVEEEAISVEEKILLTLKQGETGEIKLLIKNEKDTETKVRIEDMNLNDLLTRVSDIEFYLNPGQAKEVTFTFYADKDKMPELYMEKILIITDDAEKEVDFYVEVESLDFLFDVTVKIPEYPKTFKPGENLVAVVDFYNLGKEGETEISIEYLIKDSEGRILFGEKQILIIGISINLTKTLQLPGNIENGDYVFYVKATYDSKTASASKWFTVSSESAIGQKLKEFIDLHGVLTAQIIAAVVLAFILYQLMLSWLLWKRRLHAGKRKVINKKVKKRIAGSKKKRR